MEEQQVELIERILEDKNLDSAVEAVVSNKGAAGVDKMTVYELRNYFQKHKAEIKEQIRNKKYQPQPVRRVYIPKPNGDKRPLGIPTVVDRVVQQAVAQVLSKGYERYFSEYSYGFRPNRNAHMAIEQTILYLNEGYEWVIDIDIEKYFDTVNHDKLISILREKINDAPTLNLIRKFLRAGIMNDGLISESTMGVPQGGPLSPILSNVYLDKLDKELENRGLRFARYADDCNIFVKSERAADRVIKSITQWLEKKLRLKVNLTKSKVVRPTKSEFLGFSFYKSSNKAGWRCRPAKNRMKRLKEKIKTVLCRRKAIARPLEDTITKLNQIIIGWINYYRISDMKNFLKEFGPWMRHKLRVVIMKMWKRPKTKYKRLSQLRNYLKCNISDEQIRQVVNSRLGLYRQCGMSVVNFLLSPEVLERKIGNKPALINPLKYYEKQRLSL